MSMYSLVSSLIFYIGLATTLVAIRRFFSILHVYIAHSSTVQRYLTDDDKAYALITGASDGLGKELAIDLYERGFNLVIHGRNQAKLENFKQELLALSGANKTIPKRDVQIFIADATERSRWDFTPLKDIKFTAMFLAAGGAIKPYKSVDEMSDETIDWTVNFNATFHTHLLRYLLPSIRERQIPCFIVGIGSLSQLHPPPYVTIYAASKQYLAKFIHGLAQEDATFYPNLDITYHLMIIGEFVSAANNSPVSYLCPPARKIARAVISAVGCGHREVIPYFGHALAVGGLWMVGKRRSDKIVREYMVKNYKKELETGGAANGNGSTANGTGKEANGHGASDEDKEYDASASY